MVDYSKAAELETGIPGGTQDTEENATAGTIIWAIVDNPQKWLNVRSKPSGDATVLFQVEKGSIVEILDAGEPDWWQIRYGSRIGWAFAKYLKPLPKEDEPAPDVPSEPDAPSEPDDDTQDEPDEPFDDEPITEEQLDALVAAVDAVQIALDNLKSILSEMKGGS